MLDLVKQSLGIAQGVTINDALILNLIQECLTDLKRVGIDVANNLENEAIKGCVISYCHMHFSNDKEIWQKIYSNKRLDLSTYGVFKK